MALSKPDQFIKIVMLLREVPDKLEEHFCSTKPVCMKLCSVDGETRDKSKCALLSCSDDEVHQTVYGLDAAGRMMGIIPDE